MISPAFFPLMMAKQFPSTLRAKETSLIRREAQVEAATGRRYNGAAIGNEILMCLRSSQKRKGEVSLQDPIGTDSEGNSVSFSDLLGTPPDLVEEEVRRRVTLERVKKALPALPERERLVLDMRYGLSDGVVHPQHEIAQKLDISRSYVSRVEKHAIELLRDKINGGE